MSEAHPPTENARGGCRCSERLHARNALNQLSQGRSRMKMSRTSAFAASLLGSGLIFSPLVAASDGPPSFAHHQPDWHHGGGELELPATTACFESQLATGRANHTISGIAAAVVLDGRVVYRRGFGTVSSTSTQAVLPTTRFR